jgi:hypothetical protein
MWNGLFDTKIIIQVDIKVGLEGLRYPPGGFILSTLPEVSFAFTLPEVSSSVKLNWQVPQGHLREVGAREGSA